MILLELEVDRDVTSVLTLQPEAAAARRGD